MHPDLKKRRSFLILARTRYEVADAEWRAALREASVLVPGVRRRNCWSIGNPGSQIRRLYEARDRTLQQLTVAKVKLETARKRLERSNRPAKAELRFIAFHT